MGLDRGLNSSSTNPLGIDDDDYTATTRGAQGPKGDDGASTQDYIDKYNTVVTSAAAAGTSATNAASSNSQAAAQASTATTQAGISTTKAGEAATSATNSANSATASASSASTASTQASNASTSASTATTQASNASTSASTATTKASEASASASTSTTKASEASTSASTASTQATNAANSATAGANSATASANSATAAAASYDSFDDRFLGSKSSDPAVDNDGSALLTGAMYWSTSASAMRVYSGSAWSAISPSAAELALITIVGGELTATEDLGSIATAVTTSTGNNISIVGGAITNINTVAGAVANVNTVGSGIANVNAVGSGIANVNTVAGSIADVNRYADEYKIAATAPAGPSSGDLWYDSTANTLKYYTGSIWASIAAGIASIAADTSPQLGGALDGQNNNMTNIGTVSGSNLQMDFGGLS